MNIQVEKLKKDFFGFPVFDKMIKLNIDQIKEVYIQFGMDSRPRICFVDGNNMWVGGSFNDIVEQIKNCGVEGDYQETGSYKLFTIRR